MSFLIDFQHMLVYVGVSFGCCLAIRHKSDLFRCVCAGALSCFDKHNKEGRGFESYRTEICIILGKIIDFLRKISNKG